MRHSFSSLFVVFLLVFTCNIEAQNRRAVVKVKKAAETQSSRSAFGAAVVIDERLSVLRDAPSLFAKVVQRMRRGRNVNIIGSKENDGVTFYRINAPPNNSGWVQAEAVAGKSHKGDDARLAKLVQSSEGFEQIDRAQIFLDTFSDSSLRPAILLLMGDLMEETALKLSSEAAKRLDRREMAASGAPLHSFYLNYTSLDRYNRLGVNFLFNANAKQFHYDGANWREITKKSPKSNEAVEAQKRLDALKEKMEAAK